GYAPNDDAPVQVASVMTMAKRLDWYRAKPFDLVVIDEAHHAIAPTWGRILEAFPEAYILGVTATPERLDGKGLGKPPASFEHIIVGATVKQLVAERWLVPARTYGCTEPNLLGVRTIGGDYDERALAACRT